MTDEKVNVEDLKKVLHDAYLETANMDVSSYVSKSDLAACAASRFRESVLKKLDI